MKKNLILGIGNTLLCDDGLGPCLVEQLAIDPSFLPPHSRDSVVFKSLPAFGFDTMFEIEGYHKLIIIDSLEDQSMDLGSLKILNLGQILSMTYDGILVNHGLNLGTMWRFGEKIGMAMPKHCTLVGVRALEVKSFSTDLSPGMTKLFPQIISEIKIIIRNCLGEN